MGGHLIVITYTFPEKDRNLVRKLFGSAAVSFLAGLPSEQRYEALRRAHVLLTWNLPAELSRDELSLLDNVRLIQLMTAGADHLPYTELSPGIVIASNVGAYAEPIAEHVLAMTLALGKNLFIEHQKMSRGEFELSRLNRLLRGSVCGIVGFGNIGRAVARLMRPLGVRVQALNTIGRTEEPVEFIGSLSDLPAILSASDIVVLSLPLTRTTRGLIGTRELEWMKPDSILINVARGDIIVEHDLYAHLNDHPEFKAGIDTWWHEPYTTGRFRTDYPFFSLPNVLGSPHNSALVPGIKEHALRLAVKNVQRFLRGEPAAGIVDRLHYAE